MARYGGEVKDFPTWEGTDDWEEAYRKQDEALAKLRKTGRVIRFGVADGYAWYYVKSFKPLVLLHIPYCDNYRIEDYAIRGLNVSDVKRMIQWEENMNKLFSEKP